MEASASRSMRRVVVAEANACVRQELCELLGLMDGVEVVGRATDSAQAVHLASALHPDVVILDFAMLHKDGSGTASLIRSQLPGCLLVALAVHALEDEGEEARRVGFNFVLAMDAPPSTLIEVLQGAFAPSISTSEARSERPRSSANP